MTITLLRVCIALGGAVALPFVLVLWAWLIKKIGDWSFGFRRIEHTVVLGGGYLVLAALLYGLTLVVERALLR